MRQLLLTLACLLAVHTGVFATDGGIQYAQERVISLPQDQGKWYVSLFGDPADPQFQQLQEWFQSNSGLVNLRGQVHYNEYSVKTLRYQRYAKNLPGLPCVRVQDSRGVVTSEFWSNYIPPSGNALFKGIRDDLRDWTNVACPWQRPQPDPQPEPTPVVPADTPPNLELQAEPEPEPPSFPWLLALGAAVLGAGIGVGQGFKEEHIDAPTTPRLTKP